ncbi:MAG: tetratricopeptide repeat protein [Bacteroidia bacterium]
MRKKLFSCFYVLFFCGNFFSQEEVVDSLKLALKNAKNDTTRCKILYELAENADEGEWEKYNDTLKTLSETKLSGVQNRSEKYFYTKHLAAAFNNSGLIYQTRGDKKRALEDYSKSLKMQEEIGDKAGIAASLTNIGFIYLSQGDIAKALEYYGNSLKITEESGDKNGIAYSLSNIGVVYANQGDTTKALEYFLKSLKIREETADKAGISYSLSNIGVIYKGRGDFVKALEYYSKSLKIREEMGDKTGIANSLNNLANIYYTRGDIAAALEYFGKSLKIREEMDDKNGIAASLTDIGNIYSNQKNYSKALEYCTRSLAISRESGDAENTRNASGALKIIYQKLNQPKKALEMYELYIQMRDSISNRETKKASVKTQLKYEYEKKAAADSVKNAEAQKVKDAQLTAQTASLKQEKFQRYSLVVGLLVVLAGLGFVINRFRITQKQKKIIEEQKIKVDEAFSKLHEKNKEVLDSIYYARRIQRSLLTTEKYFSKQLNKLQNRK